MLWCNCSACNFREASRRLVRRDLEKNAAEGNKVAQPLNCPAISPGVNVSERRREWIQPPTLFREPISLMLLSWFTCSLGFIPNCFPAPADRFHFTGRKKTFFTKDIYIICQFFFRNYGQHLLYQQFNIIPLCFSLYIPPESVGSRGAATLFSLAGFFPVAFGFTLSIFNSPSNVNP